ncbi:NUDIX hydrolase [Streptomyces sp. NPDC019890]|uniref:NUDIX hydrolase n=1 Tax=Streptomyces sp. NPDC019890 TaxID=3365064 RepID=UPI00384FECC9
MTNYEALRRTHPELFDNDPSGIEILFDPDDIEAARHSAGSGEAEPVGVVYADQFITIVRDAVRFPGGALGLYVRILPTSATPGVVVLPLLGSAPDLVLVEHYRHATRAWHLEAPRGMGEAETAGAEDAARELEEELGTQPDVLIPLGEVHADSGLLGGRAELYAARIHDVGSLNTAEGIRRAMIVPFTEAEDMIRRGAITDGFTIAVITRARLAGLFDACAADGHTA